MIKLSFQIFVTKLAFYDSKTLHWAFLEILSLFAFQRNQANYTKRAKKRSTRQKRMT
jgi:hypothetical protein